MSKIYDIKSELKIVKEEVDFFRCVRFAIKEAQQSAIDFHLGVNEDVIINAMCRHHKVSRESYDITAKYFNLYIMDLIKR